MKRTNGKQWLPTIKEGTELQRQNMLHSGVLIDFGLALYDDRNPDEEIAQSLSATAKAKNYAMPILASFKSLDLKMGGAKYGVMPQIVSADGLYHGAEAESLLSDNSFYRENSGVRSLLRYRNGNLYANWSGVLVNFIEYCRVGRVSAEGSAQNLEQEVLENVSPTRKSLDSIFSSTQ